MSDMYQKIDLPNGISYKQPLGLFINNEFVKGVDGTTIKVTNPSNGEYITSVHEAKEHDVDLAVATARKALDSWRKIPTSERGRIILKLADLMDEHKEVLASIETLDNGKAIQLADGDVKNSTGCIRYYGGWADKIHGKTINTDEDSMTYTRHEPVGVCGQIIPWNFPLLMFCWKIGPAVAAGNTIVMKTAESTPLTALYMAELIKKAGFPPGVINIVSGYGATAGNAIAYHMDIDKVAFTGSTIVGRKILEASAKSNLKKTTLELGGKSPNIVFKDADLEKTLEWINFGIYWNGGQSCVAGSRIYVQEDIYDTFVKSFIERTKKNVVGDPFDRKVFQGSVTNETQFDKIMKYIDIGKKEGATVLTGGNRHGDKGLFIEPTVFGDVKEDMTIMQEEIFGPVCAIAKFKDAEDVVSKANGTMYGLAAAVHTRDLNTAIDVSNKLQAGTVWVNQYNMAHYQIPFGGYKQSGIGRELGKYALANYTNVKAVSVNLNKTL